LPDNNQILNVMIASAAEGVKAANRVAQDMGVISEEKTNIYGEQELVTNGDLQANQCMLSCLEPLLLPIITEEVQHNQTAVVESERFITVDPIDGTLEYKNGGTGWGSLVGLVEHGLPMAGVIQHSGGGLIVADAEKGCVVDGQSVSLHSEGDHVLVAPLGPWTPDVIHRIVELLVSEYGYKLVTANSTVEATHLFFQCDAALWVGGAEKIWDSTAPTAAVLAAGGRVRLTSGHQPTWNQLSTPMMYARNVQHEWHFMAVLHALSR